MACFLNCCDCFFFALFLSFFLFDFLDFLLWYSEELEDELELYLLYSDLLLEDELEFEVENDDLDEDDDELDVDEPEESEGLGGGGWIILIGTVFVDPGVILLWIQLLKLVALVSLYFFPLFSVLFVQLGHLFKSSISSSADSSLVQSMHAGWKACDVW